MFGSASYPFNSRDYQPQQLRDRLVESEIFLGILLDVMSLENDVEDPSDFILRVLELICHSTKRAIGIAWFLDQSVDRLVYRSHVDVHHIETAQFVEVTQRCTWASGEGFPGRVWREQLPIWVANIGAEPSFQRQAEALDAGLKSSFAFPIQSHGGVIGVLEFFGRRLEEADVRHVEVLTRLGLYIGLVLERKDSDIHLREIQATQKRLQEQLRSTADEAIASARLKSEFVANVSHEIRTPLAGIMGMSELLMTQEDISAETKDVAGFILASAHSLLAIVNDLLDFSKLEAGKMSLHKTWFSVSGLLSEIARSIAVAGDKKGLPIKMELDDAIPQMVRGDRGRLLQILHNFGSNAVKFTEAGEIRLVAKLESMNGNSVRIRFSVSDTGIGINPEAGKQLFEPFVQADGTTTRKYGGTGLGLSISKKLTELMNGEVALESEEGKGSTFHVVVPLEISEEKLIG